MRGELGIALNRGRNLPDILQEVAEILARHQRLSAVSVWTLGPDGTRLELQASAGPARRPDDAPRVVAVGQQEIGLIAEERRPYTTNTLLDDPRLGESEWARREGLTRVPEDRPLSGVPTWMRPEQLWEVLKSFVVLPFRLWANFRVWARSTEAWAEGLRARYRQRLDRGFDGSPSRSGRVRA